MVASGGHDPGEPPTPTRAFTTRPKINYPTRYNPKRPERYPGWKIQLDSYLDNYELLEVARHGPPSRDSVKLDHPELDPSAPTTPARLGALYRHAVAEFLTKNRELFNVVVSYVDLDESIELRSPARRIRE